MRTGLDDPEPNNGEPEELADWIAAGFRAEEAEVWRQWRISIAAATAWRTAGVDDGLRAAQWWIAGVTPDSVQAWRDAAIESTEAVRWHELGFDLTTARRERQKGLGPEEAHNQAQAARASGGTWTRRSASSVALFSSGPGGLPGPVQPFRAAGVHPRLMQGYMQHQWLDNDAVAWASQGIEANDAYLWHELGLTPLEAARLSVQGRAPGEVIREWWRAGIPFDEVADWIGAGLSADEATDQRAKGITAEHAAALRALRHDEDPPPRTGGLPPGSPMRLGPPRATPTGPPPEDEDAARAEIVEAFAGMLTPDQSFTAVPTVQGGSNLGRCLAQAAERLTTNEAVTSSVSARAIEFLNEREARVSYDVVVSGGVNIQLPERSGRAVLVDGVWKVARETFCDYIRMAGVECPPPERAP